jgi:hypothetical protein
MVIVLILVGIAAAFALAAVPLLLPWPKQLRWLLASTSVPDPMGMSAGPYPLMLREVTVAEVHRSGEGVAVELAEISHATPSFYVLPAGAATADAVACLDHWSVQQVPLLLVVDADSDVSLHGSVDTVVGLRPVAPGGEGPRIGLPVPSSSDRGGGRRARWRAPALVTR